MDPRCSLLVLIALQARSLYFPFIAVGSHSQLQVQDEGHFRPLGLLVLRVRHSHVRHGQSPPAAQSQYRYRRRVQHGQSQGWDFPRPLRKGLFPGATSLPEWLEADGSRCTCASVFFRFHVFSPNSWVAMKITMAIEVRLLRRHRR